MRSQLASLAIALLLALPSAAEFDLASIERVTSDDTVPGRYFVEVENLGVVDGLTKRSSHEAVYAALRKRGIPFDVVNEWDNHDLFVGAALELSNPEVDGAELINTPGVRNVFPVSIVPGPDPVYEHVLTGVDDPAFPADSWSTHVMTGVDKLHAEGILGQGIKIGIIDGGVDYNHPALGGGFGPGFKFAQGYDFVGDAYTGTNTPQPDNDPLDQCRGHGTHVAGIVGADPNNKYNVTGVAYEASFAAYRVFGCTGNAADDVVVDALLRAYDDGMHVINMSLGQPSGWASALVAVIASRIAEQGRVVVNSVGNAGASGAFYVETPSTGRSVIGVGSVENSIFPIQNATLSNGHDPIPYFSLKPFPFPGPMPIYATSTDTTVAADACSALPSTTPNLANYLVIVRRGGCAFTQKLANIAAKGARVSFIYNAGGAAFSQIDVGSSVSALIREEDGIYLVQQFAAGADLTISFPTGADYGTTNPLGGLMSDFSNAGPSNDMRMKPNIVAPGGNIASLMPLTRGEFAIQSGTSMATPFVAGVAALVLQVRGTTPDVAWMMKTLLQTTARSVPSTKSDDQPFASISKQGAGLVNAWNAAKYGTYVTPSEMLLNDTLYFKGQHTIRIYNARATSQTFFLSHFPVGTVNHLRPNSIQPALYPTALTTQFATASLSQSTVTIFPYGFAEVTVTITPPQGVTASQYPIYSGFIKIRGAGETLQVPYLGVAGNLKQQQVLDNTNYPLGVKLPGILTPSNTIQGNPRNYTFVGNDYPSLLYRLTAGTQRLVVDLVASDIQLTPTFKRELADGQELAPKLGLSRRGSLFRFIIDWFKRQSPPLPPPNTYDQVPTVGTLTTYNYHPRNIDAQVAVTGYRQVAFTTGVFSNGTIIPNGQYKILIRALKIGGDFTQQADYESWLSPIIGVTRP